MAVVEGGGEEGGVVGVFDFAPSSRLQMMRD